jgi:hypothetical protein
MNATKIVARLEVNTEEGEFTIIVRQYDVRGYEVFIDGGMLSTGEASERFTNMAAAWACASGEAALALS